MSLHDYWKTTDFARDEQDELEARIDRILASPEVLLDLPHGVAGCLRDVPPEHRSALADLLKPMFREARFAGLKAWVQSHEDAAELALEYMGTMA